MMASRTWCSLSHWANAFRSLFGVPNLRRSKENSAFRRHIAATTASMFLCTSIPATLKELSIIGYVGPPPGRACARNIKHGLVLLPVHAVHIYWFKCRLRIRQADELDLSTTFATFDRWVPLY